jgi:hypothetical protein
MFRFIIIISLSLQSSQFLLKQPWVVAKQLLQVLKASIEVRHVEMTHIIQFGLSVTHPRVVQVFRPRYLRHFQFLHLFNLIKLLLLLVLLLQIHSLFSSVQESHPHLRIVFISRPRKRPIEVLFANASHRPNLLKFPFSKLHLFLLDQ